MKKSVQSFNSLSVVIPAYNAERVVAATLDDVEEWLSRTGLTCEIIVVDDGSRDGTPGIVEKRGGLVRLLRNEQNRGKGFSVRRGMLETRHAWALFMDVDNSTRIHHLEQFADHAEKVDVIIASRRLAGSRIVRRQHKVRQMLGRSFPYLVRAVAIPDVSDTQCGFKAFSRQAVERIFPLQRIERFAFDVELLLLARKMGMRIAEVPVDWDNPTDSTVRIRIDTLQMMADVLRTTWRLRRGVPKA